MSKTIPLNTTACVQIHKEHDAELVQRIEELWREPTESALDGLTAKLIEEGLYPED